MRSRDVDSLDSSIVWWVPAVRAPRRDWPGAPGCRRGARFLIDERTFQPARDNFPCFASRGECLQWILAHRPALVRAAPDAAVAPVNLAHWLLGLA